MRLGTRTSKKTLEKESKRYPNTKVHQEPQGQFGTFGVPNGTLKGLNFHVLGFGPTTRVTIMHTLFNLFAKGCVRIQNLIARTYCLESSSLYKQRLNLIILNLFFLRFERHTFFTFKPPIFSDSLSEYCYLNQGFQVSKRIEQIFLNLKTSSQE